MMVRAHVASVMSGSDLVDWSINHQVCITSLIIEYDAV